MYFICITDKDRRLFISSYADKDITLCLQRFKIDEQVHKYNDNTLHYKQNEG